MRMSRPELLLNLSPLLMAVFVSRNIVSVSEISAVNLIVGWYLFACSMNCITFSLFVFLLCFLLSFVLLSYFRSFPSHKNEAHKQ